MSNTQILLAGSAAAFSVDLLIYPLDTIKTKIQSTNPQHRQHLFRGLYKGVGSVIIATLPSSAVFFTTYESLNTGLAKMDVLPDPLRHSLASAIAELASCAVLTPAEIIKQNAQVSSLASGATITAAKKLNFGGLTQGFATLAGRNLPFTAMQFPIYEYIRKRLADQATSPIGKAGGAAIAAASGGSVAALITQPIDVLKSRIMLANSQGPNKAGLVSVMGDIWAKEGVKGMMRGGLMRTVWTAAGSGIYLGTYETAKMWLKGEFE